MVDKLNPLILTLQNDNPISKKILKYLKPWDISNLIITCSKLYQNNLSFRYCTIKGHRIWNGRRVKNQWGSYCSYDHNCFCGYNGPGCNPPKNITDFMSGLWFVIPLPKVISI